MKRCLYAVSYTHLDVYKRQLDTLNQAFENLLDSCYKDTAWDVSTDISVLNTMLANEGLTGDELSRRTQVKIHKKSEE